MHLDDGAVPGLFPYYFGHVAQSPIQFIVLLVLLFHLSLLSLPELPARFVQYLVESGLLLRLHQLLNVLPAFSLFLLFPKQLGSLVEFFGVFSRFF